MDRMRRLRSAPIVESPGASLRAQPGPTAVVGLFILALVAWHTPVVYPVTVLITFFHQMSHALGAWLTGGHVARLVINGEHGATQADGLQIVMLSAGYLGSMFWGAALMLGAFKTHLSKFVSWGVGAALLAATALFVRNQPGALWGLGFSAAFLLLPLLPKTIANLALGFIGLTSMLYALVDMTSTLTGHPVPGSDAELFSQLIPLPPQVWSALWSLASLATLAFVLWICLRKRRTS